jgi:SAM-dependent methyltransferase
MAIPARQFGGPGAAEQLQRIDMPVSREDAIYAYRLILGREPESEAVIGQAMAADNLAHLRNVFLASSEFIERFDSGPRPLPVARFLEASDIDVDLECAPEQLQAMFDRIAKAWRSFGETEPHWSVLVDDGYRQENLEANIDRFYRSGVADIDIHLNFLRRLAHPTSFGKALDFGCGVGRLTLALGTHAGQVVGVDISPPHLELAAERARAQSIANVAFEPIASVEDLDRYRDFDLVISRIVLQHNPPPVMAALLAGLLRALAPGGIAIIQIPTFIQGYSFSVGDYLASEQPQMEMNYLPQPVIYRLIDEADCRLIEVREDPAAGDNALSHTFVMQKREAQRASC